MVFIKFRKKLTTVRRLAGPVTALDINMPVTTGIDLVRSLQQKPLVIFTTAHKQFAIEGFELDAVDYVLKPIQFDRFSKAINKAIDHHKYKNSASQEYNDNLFVHAECRLVKTPLADIEISDIYSGFINTWMKK